MIQATENVRSLARSMGWLVCDQSLIHNLRLLRHKTCRRENLRKLWDDCAASGLACSGLALVPPLKCGQDAVESLRGYSRGSHNGGTFGVSMHSGSWMWKKAVWMNELELSVIDGLVMEFSENFQRQKFKMESETALQVWPGYSVPLNVWSKPATLYSGF